MKIAAFKLQVERMVKERSQRRKAAVVPPRDRCARSSSSVHVPGIRARESMLSRGCSMSRGAVLSVLMQTPDAALRDHSGADISIRAIALLCTSRSGYA